jgi:hypothetical protein
MTSWVFSGLFEVEAQFGESSAAKEGSFFTAALGLPCPSAQWSIAS